jgi:hypothetical protein
MLAPSIPDTLTNWLARSFPEFPFVYWGQSGSTMLFDALTQAGRKTLVLPAFICPSVAAMGKAVGLKLVFIDADPATLQMDRTQLENCLADSPEAETVLLVDHTFGYPFPALNQIRRGYPRLLIIEDCVRALGSTVDGRPVGHTGDWVLLSLYKTVRGNNHGAVLLTRTPYSIRSGPPPRISWKQWAAGLSPARLLYDLFVKPRYPDFRDTPRPLQARSWNPQPGSPNSLCLQRFQHDIAQCERSLHARRTAEAELRTALDAVPGMRVVRPAAGCETNGIFLSFTIAADGKRNRLLDLLHRRRLFLLRTWDAVPAFYSCYSAAFPFGNSGSVFLADHVVHAPMAGFMKERQRRLLVQILTEHLASNHFTSLDSKQMLPSSVTGKAWEASL